MGKLNIFFDLEKDAKARVQSFIDIYKDPSYDGFEGPLMRALHVTSATSTTDPFPSATTIFSLTVTPELLNPRGTMHGGCIALLVDMCTSLAVAPLATKDFWHFNGVTRTLGVTCLKPVPGGEKIIVECIVRGIGKRLATISCMVKDEKGVLLAMGEHNKAAIPSEPLANQGLGKESKL